MEAAILVLLTVLALLYAANWAMAQYLAALKEIAGLRLANRDLMRALTSFIPVVVWMQRCTTAAEASPSGGVIFHISEERAKAIYDASVALSKLAGEDPIAAVRANHTQGEK